MDDGAQQYFLLNIESNMLDIKLLDIIIDLSSIFFYVVCIEDPIKKINFFFVENF